MGVSGTATQYPRFTRRLSLKIADIEIIELQNIPVTPPLFKQPLRTGVRLLKLKTDDGIVGLSQIGGFMHSATRRFDPARARAVS